MSFKNLYFLLLSNGINELAVSIPKSDIESIEQLMNGIFFNYPNKISFCLDLINKIKEFYLQNNQRIRGLDLLKSILKNFPETKIRIVNSEYGMIINSFFDHDKGYFDSISEKQDYINMYIKGCKKITFDGFNIKTRRMI